MKKIQINRITVWDYSEKKESIEFPDWEIEVHPATDFNINYELNKVRTIAKKIFQGKYKTNCQVHLITKEL